MHSDARFFSISDSRMKAFTKNQFSSTNSDLFRSNCRFGRTRRIHLNQPYMWQFIQLAKRQYICSKRASGPGCTIRLWSTNNLRFSWIDKIRLTYHISSKSLKRASKFNPLFVLAENSQGKWNVMLASVGLTVNTLGENLGLHLAKT